MKIISNLICADVYCKTHNVPVPLIFANFAICKIREIWGHAKFFVIKSLSAGVWNSLKLVAAIVSSVTDSRKIGAEKIKVSHYWYVE